MINCTRTEEEEDFLRPGPYLIVENSDFYLSVFCLYHPWISGLHFFVSLISNKIVAFQVPPSLSFLALGSESAEGFWIRFI